MILFLDYDGVLHPDAVFLENGKPVLKAQGTLFMWTPQLVDVLADYPCVQIVLSTSWVRILRYDRAKSYLPVELSSRVVGATWHSHMSRHPEASHRVSDWWSTVSRYQQIRRYVDRAALNSWLAIDDHPEGWYDAELDRLVVTNSRTGLSEPGVIEQLDAKLRLMRSLKLG